MTCCGSRRTASGPGGGRAAGDQPRGLPAGGVHRRGRLHSHRESGRRGPPARRARRRDPPARHGAHRLRAHLRRAGAGQDRGGGGPLLVEQAPIALSPNHPENVTVQAPRLGNALRENVQGDITAIFLALGAVALLVGGLGIANVTLLGVMERVGEIGLRRALGATRGQIAAQFVTESVTIGLLGGLIGAALGSFAVVGISIAQQWTPILDLALVGGAAALGGLIGLLAGAYPAFKAASLEPVAALRGGL